MRILLCSAALLLSSFLQAAVWRVGPTRTYTFCSQLSALVKDGDTVLIDASTYTDDAQVTWTANRLLIRGVGGRPVLIAGPKLENNVSNGKGIFVVKGNQTTIENLDFRNAKVPDHNGAGIRQEGLDLLVRYCRFAGNEMGILAGGYIPGCTVIIEYSEFLNGGSPQNPGYQHNIYINHIDTFIFRYNFSHDAIAEGHELKSRADHTFILYNRISNFNSADSRNVDIPNGGTAVLMGNVFEQGTNSVNTNMVAFGLEGYINPGPHNLFVVNNTFVNRNSKGVFVQVATPGTDTFFVKNNIFAGPKTGGLLLGTAAVPDSGNNFISDALSAPGWVNQAQGDYRLSAVSPAVNAGVMVFRSAKGLRLTPEWEYADTCSRNARGINGKLDVGAYEYQNSSALKESRLTDLQLRLWPNPSDGFLHVEGLPEGLVYLSLIRADGAEVISQQRSITEGSTALHLEGLAAGAYFLRVESKAGCSMQAFLIQ